MMINDPKEIARTVRAGIRTKKDLRTCGCANCLEALKILAGDKKRGR